MTGTIEDFSTALAGRYAIEREVGRGGMATVFLAQDVKHGRRVAIKVLQPELAAVLGGERFLREIEIAARLAHPHILPLHDSGEVAGQFFYVMPFVEGVSLRDRLRREHQLPVDEAVRLTQQVASALDYAHRRNVVHRDIKPENILLQEGHALVADFGIALAVSEAGGERLTGTGLSLGTPYYMSPEQAMGERNIDARSDIYALGCVLYEMLAGEPPFTGPSPQAVVARILTEQPRELHAVRESVTPALQRVVSRALARLPADRYATAGRFSEALSAAAGETWASELAARPESSAAARPAFGAGSLARRRSLPWAVAALAVAAATFAWQGPRPSDPVTPEGEVSTEALERILANNEAVVLDTRPHLEYAISHIPGSQNVAARPGVPMSLYISDVAEVRRLVDGDTTRPIVLYCNGPFCPRSTRFAGELEAAGYTNVRRYQLGIPVWRAFGGVTATSTDGLRHVVRLDRTAVLIDTRDDEAFRAGTLPGARNIPRSLVLAGRDVGVVRQAKDDGRLPMQDHNTRIIVIGSTGDDARFVAQALAHEAFHNVSFFDGTYEQARAATASPRSP
ncbi:MAG: protein kinase [Gemmatimonadaceae bacterium]|nr:protein kinase [Gemmatimonadaceae bacterium]